MDTDDGGGLTQPPEESNPGPPGPGTEDNPLDHGEIKPKTSLSHTTSLPGSTKSLSTSPSQPQDITSGAPTKRDVFKHQSFRIKRGPKDAPGGSPGESTPPSERGSRWSFGGVAKAVGSGVTAFGSGVVQGTRAVGTGVVKGTKAVGSGVVEGTKAVGSGVVEGTKAVGSGAKAVGSGVVEGTKVVASVSKDVTLAAGNKVSSFQILFFFQCSSCLK